jgi:hypothetical protein
MDRAESIWNRSLTDYHGEIPRAGDHALAAVLLVHGLIMNGGVLNAVEIIEEERLAAAKLGYEYFGCGGVADLLTRAKEALSKKPAAPEELERYAVGDVEVILMLEDTELDELEPKLDLEYASYIPDDSWLFERFKQRLADSPGDFAGV